MFNLNEIGQNLKYDLERKKNQFLTIPWNRTWDAYAQKGIIQKDSRESLYREQLFEYQSVPHILHNYNYIRDSIMYTWLDSANSQ